MRTWVLKAYCSISPDLPLTRNVQNVVELTLKFNCEKRPSPATVRGLFKLIFPNTDALMVEIDETEYVENLNP